MTRSAEEALAGAERRLARIGVRARVEAVGSTDEIVVIRPVDRSRAGQIVLRRASVAEACRATGFRYVALELELP